LLVDRTPATGSAIDAVTGVFSYTGAHIASALVQRGRSVRGLVRTISPSQPAEVESFPLQFDDRAELARALAGVDTLYNTYWIRFERRGVTFESAVRNTAMLARAARRAGVRRVVHLSVSNPSTSSPYAYFRGKAQAEEAIHQGGVPSSILRPTLIFGREDILVNNLAWLMRRFPVLPVPGSGHYCVQPIDVDDVARLAVEEAAKHGDRTLDVAGPETLRFTAMLEQLRSATRGRARLVHMSREVASALGQLVGVVLRDVLITREELSALEDDLLISHSPPLGVTSFSEWVSDHGAGIGRRYRWELRRHWTQ
jgi:uncharacterized protein YbjT (DUF2867 family)